MQCKIIATVNKSSRNRGEKVSSTVHRRRQRLILLAQLEGHHQVVDLRELSQMTISIPSPMCILLQQETRMEERSITTGLIVIPLPEFTTEVTHLHRVMRQVKEYLALEEARLITAATTNSLSQAH